jgi:glucose-1-phosphate cytidylyltransferase
MKHYSSFGFNEFVIALGYKGESIINWMYKYYDSNKNVSVKKSPDEIVFHDKSGQRARKAGWRVHLVDTGLETLTGGRVKRLAPWIGNAPFMLTWCDAVSNVDINSLLKFHYSHGRLATVTAVRPPPRFGHLVLEGNSVTEFKEKSQGSEGWINGAYFVLEPGIFGYIEGDSTQFEKEPLEQLARDNQLMAYRHEGFWQCMDTIHEKEVLEKIWQSGQAPWKIWTS